MFRGELLDLQEILSYVKRRTDARGGAAGGGSPTAAAAAAPVEEEAAAASPIAPGGVNLFFGEPDLDAGTSAPAAAAMLVLLRTQPGAS